MKITKLGGQQDITLFFTRILDAHNPEYRNNFNNEYLTLVKRIRKRIKEREKEKAAKQENGETSNQQKSTA